MPKLYLKYKQAASLGIVNSSNGPICYSKDGKHAIVPALENAAVWDLRKGELIATWEDIDNTSEVTCIERSPDGDKFAVGYADGSIRLWDYETSSTTTTFTGHKTAVSAFAFSRDGSRLASGSRDTDLVIWDTISETGLYRLRGHKDQITGLKFIESIEFGCDHLVSCSKDTMMKFWDLGTQHCVETVIAHRGEVWALELFEGNVADPKSEAATLEDRKKSRTIVTGGSEGEVRVWKLDLKVLSEKLEPVDNGAIGSSFHVDEEKLAELKAKEADAAAKTLRKCVESHGLLERQSKERVLTIKVHDSRRYLVVQGTDRIAEVYKIRTESELRQREARLKQRRKKEKKSEDMDVDEESKPLITIADEIPRVSAIRCGGKIRSIDVSPSTKSASTTKEEVSFHIVCSLTTNQIEVHTAGLDSKDEPTRQELVLDSAGHRNDIRTLALSSDDQTLVSGSHNSIKLWNIETRKCLSTMESGYALCSTFVPGNNHVVIGTKTGELQIFHLGSYTMIENIQAHEGALWSMQVWPDRRGITTGSADKDVKFWEFALVQEPNGAKRLTLTHVRTLKLNEDVLCVRHSHDGKLLAVSLLDCTVKVFYADSLKFFLSLYGHTLPVLSMDISSDGTLIATGSADKSVKIWGLDFGDCHRSLRAHDDSVMAVKWVFGTHYLVTGGKDRLVKWWDADKFEQIMKVQGHHGEVWALAVGKYGNIVVSGSHDRSIRIWEKTDEQFAIEEERERELEEMYEKQNLDDDDKNNRAIGSGVATDAEIDGVSKSVSGMGTSGEAAEVGDASRKTAQTMLAGEKIIAAMDICEEETEKKAMDAAAEAKPEPSNPYVVAAQLEDWPPEAYVLHVVEGIRSGDLEQALLMLPFAKVIELLKILLVWVEQGWNTHISSRVLHHILQSHQNEIVSSRVCRPVLLKLKALIPAALRKERDTIGFNLAGLKYMRRDWDANHSKEFMEAIGEEDESEKKGKGNSKNKRKRVVAVSR
ncbi:WD40 repeat-like protein [Rhizoclosmatium globosum]|uniref:WD40 repeat-like protein n=1 Tax=Rhizoclosmatium globosum TaxID=329046 RepID=A0A1Y2CPV5_9FUNG|nr:WD40 repeat-like protein [Rhizoclosmatium globosum]|eukprot:ORY49061.1 WD40 repeat-like protein [Rhizoclosmatium globosum]